LIARPDPKVVPRIQARAIRRCGELLRTVPVASGAHMKQEGAHPFLTREQVATDAGLSEHQRKTALRLTAIPEQDFVAQIESDKPPTITALAKQGTVEQPKPLIDLRGIPPADYARATEAIGPLRRFSEFCKAQPPARIAGALMPHEVASVLKNVSIVDAWLDEFVANLKE
jgi:hypothetical protein